MHYLKTASKATGILAITAVVQQGTTAALPPFILDPPNKFDEHYMSTVRKNFGTFHENLSQGNYSGNGLLVADDVHWNYDGNMIIGREAWVNALTTVVDGSLKGLYIPDLYRIVDGNVGAVLYRLQGNQSGPFAGVPLTPGAQFHVAGAELTVFDEDALLYDLISIEPIGQMVAQMSGKADLPPPVPRGTQPRQNPQTHPSYRALLRERMKSMHRNANAGDVSANELLAVEDVIVDENGNLSSGRAAFVDTIAARSAGLGAFPDKQIHDDYILADGQLGAIEYVWHGIQQEPYLEISPGNGSMVRMRGMLFFEFNDVGLVEKVVSVYDEAVIGAQLSGSVKYLYP